MDTVVTQVFKVVSTVLKVPLQELNESSSAQTIVQWDSLEHVNLILALEKNFAIQFREDQIVNMSNVKSIILAVEELKGLSGEQDG